ncbi:hypothetical protein Mgra_00006318, partial [Meloidogyne graminicola]
MYISGSVAFSTTFEFPFCASSTTSLKTFKADIGREALDGRPQFLLLRTAFKLLKICFFKVLLNFILCLYFVKIKKKTFLYFCFNKNT